MKAIILAAGLGRRMRPLTDHRHKTLLPIASTTILHRLLTSLRDNGVHDVCIVTGYRPDEIVEAVSADFADLHVQFVHNPQYSSTNNVYSMALALETIVVDDDILLIESDLILDPRVLESMINSPYDNAALVDRYRPGLDGTVVSVGPDDVIGQVYPSYLQDEKFDFSDKFKTLNIYRFERNFARTTFKDLLSFYSGSIDNNCYYELLLGVLIYMRATTVHAQYVQYPWAEVDDPNDLLFAEFQFNPEARSSLVDGSWGGYWNMPHLDFAFMRNCYFPTPAVVAEMRGHLGVLMSSYGSSQAVLNRKLSYVEQCSNDHVFLLNGASQVYPLLHRAFKGARVLLPAPTFGEYNRAFPSAASYADRGSIDWDDLRETAATADVVVIVNPNNPTGTLLPSARILELISERPEKTFIVDESFIDFSGEPSIMSAVEQLGLSNVVIVKSLSKSFGVPGIRLGYVYTLNEVIKKLLWSEIPIWNVNSVAENFLEIILKHRPALEQSYVRTMSDRDAFARHLAELGVVDHVFPSGGNFVLVRLVISQEETEALAETLMSDHLVHIKDVSNKFDDARSYLRLAVRKPEDNVSLCRILAKTVPCEVAPV